MAEPNEPVVIPEDIRQAGAESVLAYQQQERYKSQAKETPAEPPATEEPPVIQTPPSENQPDYSFFGENVKTIDDAKAVYKKNQEELDQLRQLKEKFTGLENEKTEMQKLLEAKEDPFADENLFKLNELVKTTGRKDYENLVKIAGSDFKTMGDLDVLLLKEANDHPDRKINPSLVTKKILSQFGLKAEKPYDMTEEEEETWEINQYNLKDAADKARQDLSKLTEGIKKPEKVTPDILKQRQETQKQDEAKKLDELRKSWDGVVNEYLKADFKKIPIQIEGKEAGSVINFMDFEISDKTKEGLRQLALDFVTKENMPFEVDSLKELNSFVSDMYFHLNKPSIFKAIVNKARSMDNDEWNKYVHNPSGLKDNDSHSQSESPMDFNRKQQMESLKYL